MRKFYPFLILAGLVGIFFGKTLWGEEFFVTPDYGLSDIINHEYPAKVFLAQSLKNHELPLWSREIASGYPYCAAYPGCFNPINIFLFYFLPSHLAFNWSLAVVYLTVGIFTYLYIRTLKLGQEAALFGAILFTFCGYFASHIIHFLLIQTLSFFPPWLYLVESYIKKPKKYILLIFLSFAVAIATLSGFYQFVLYSLIILVIYVLCRSRKSLFLILLAIAAGFLVSAVGLLPSLEFTKQSIRHGGVNVSDIKLFPYPFMHLASFIWPYVFGDPRNGTYPPYSENWGLFWENTGYIGVLPLLFAAVAVFAGRKKYPIVRVFIAIFLISLLLLLGFKSPTFFLYYFPPLSFFRVPSKWLAFVVFALCVLAAIGFEISSSFLKKKVSKSTRNLIIWAAILTATINVLIFSYFYNLRGDSDKWLKPTQTANFLHQDTSIWRAVSLGNYLVWNEEFLKRGWAGGEEAYVPFREALDPDSNIPLKIEETGLYAVIPTTRDATMRAIVDQNTTQVGSKFKIENAAKNIMNIQNVKYIISPFDVEGTGIVPVFKTDTNPAYTVYENKSFMPRVYIASNFQVATNAQEQFMIIVSEKFNPYKTVVLENDPGVGLPKEATGQAQIVKYSAQKTEIDAKVSGGGFLVLADAYFPGWKASVDGVEAPILAANINQRAVFLTAGKHLVRFYYQPESFRLGLIISLVTLICLLIGVFYHYHFVIPAKAGIQK